MKRVHFADLPIGARFRKGSWHIEKIKPIYEKGPKGRGRLRYNARNVKTGNYMRGNFMMVEIDEEGEP